jgi:hypothetical protein
MLEVRRYPHVSKTRQIGTVEAGCNKPRGIPLWGSLRNTLFAGVRIVLVRYGYINGGPNPFHAYNAYVA